MQYAYSVSQYIAVSKSSISIENYSFYFVYIIKSDDNDDYAEINVYIRWKSIFITDYF